MRAQLLGPKRKSSLRSAVIAGLMSWVVLGCHEGSPHTEIVSDADTEVGKIPMHTLLDTSVQRRIGIDPDSASSGMRGAVMLFLGVDCPIANRYSPTIQTLAERLGELEIGLYLVYTDRYFDRAAIDRHVAEYQLPGAVLVDHDLRLQRATAVEVTPEAVLVDSSGRLRYRGRIDDRYVDFGVYRQEASRQDLRLAVEALASNETIEVPETRAIGCYISRAELPQPLR